MFSVFCGPKITWNSVDFSIAFLKSPDYMRHHHCHDDFGNNAEMLNSVHASQQDYILAEKE
eukprot:4372812-Amphidinium_carterae.1